MYVYEGTSGIDHESMVFFFWFLSGGELLEHAEEAKYDLEGA
jgi:hypothetical protein